MLHAVLKQTFQWWSLGAQQDVVDMGAASLAAMNQHIHELGQAEPSAQALGGLAQALAAGQVDLAQAATKLATGAVAPGAWASAYGPASLPAVYARAQARPRAMHAKLPWCVWQLILSVGCRCTRAALHRAKRLLSRSPGADGVGPTWALLRPC